MWITWSAAEAAALQSPADMFHFLSLSLSLCLSLFYECAVLSPGQHGWMSDGVH